MSPGDLGMTAALSATARALGVDHDLTPFALRERAFNDMIAAATDPDETRWNEAKARFEALGSTLRVNDKGD